MARSGKVQAYKDNGGKWRWRRLARNGAIVAASGESFSGKGAAIEAAESEARNADVDVEVLEEKP